MSRSRIFAALLAALAAAAAFGPGLRCAPAAGRLEPDPPTQAALEEAIAAIVRQDPAADDRVAALRSLPAGRESLLLQLALALETSGGTERSMAGALLLRRLDPSPRELIGTLVPRLDEARPTLRRVFTEMLATIDRRDGGAPDFGVYAAWLAERGGPPPAPLVRYLFETAPGEARRCLRRVDRTAPPAAEADRAFSEMEALWARRDASRAMTEGERGRAAAALDTLGRSPAWWDRRYAAAILDLDRALGTPALERRLEMDPDPLVRTTRASGSLPG